MKSKYYNLTEQANNNVKDEAPEWMDELFNNGIKPLEKGNPFYGVDDPILNPTNKGINKKVSKCSICGTPLSSNEIDLCSNCI